MTTTFMIEAMAAANAQLRWKRREQEEVSGLQHGSRLGETPTATATKAEPSILMAKAGRQIFPRLSSADSFHDPIQTSGREKEMSLSKSVAQIANL